MFDIKTKLDKVIEKNLASVEDKLTGLQEELSILLGSSGGMEPKVFARKEKSLRGKITKMEAKRNMIVTHDFQNPEYPYKTHQKYATELAQVSAGIYSGSKKEFVFNMQSHVHVGDFLYDHPSGLRIPKPLITKSKKDSDGLKTYTKGYFATTDKKILQELKDKSGFIDKYLVFKQAKRIVKSNIESLLARTDYMGRVHTSYNKARTQRLTSGGGLNLQNLPSRSSIEVLSELIKTAKRSIIPERKGCLYFEADYSQFEIRVIGEYAEELTMAKAYQDGKDLHTMTACMDLGLTEAQFLALDKKKQKMVRQNGKTSNFSIIYKTSPGGFSRAAKAMYGVIISEEEAGRRIQNFNSLYPQISAFHRKVIKEGQENGYVKTGIGSRRHLLNIKHTDVSKRNADERVACNTGTQGLGAQLLLISAYALDWYIEILGYDARVELTVHDSLNGWFDETIKDEFCHLIKWAMENPPTEIYFDWQFKHMPVVAEVDIGPNWADVKNYI